MSRFLIDTNIWTRRLQSGHQHHETSQNALESLIKRGDELFVTPQVLIELTGFLTRPLLVRDAQGHEVNGGLGLSIGQALQEVATIETICDLLPETPTLWSEWKRLVLLCPPQGKAVHNARHAATIKVNNLTHVLTFNTEDFSRHASEGITPVDPRTL